MCLDCLPIAEPGLAVAVYEAGRLRRKLSERAIRSRKTRIVTRYEQAMTRALRRAFNKEADRVLDLARAFTVTPRPVVESREAQSWEEIARFLMNGQDITPYRAILLDAYGDIMPEAMNAVIEQIVARGIGIGGDLMNFPQAQEWIRQHRIEFSERWAKSVGNHTNNRIRAQLAEGWRQNEGMEDLIGRVKNVYREASDVRAEMIARTESNRAYSSANLEMARELGAATKFWIISGTPYSLVDVCSENDARGSIPMTGMFTDIDGLPIDGPPAHVNCLCDIGYDFADDWQAPVELEV